MSPDGVGTGPGSPGGGNPRAGRDGEGLAVGAEPGRAAGGEAGAASLRWNGEALRLRSDGALWWPRGRILFVADLHLGKGAAFRARGVPVPTGDTQSDLERLDRAVEGTRAGHLVILGDLFHAPESRDTHVERGLTRWRAGRPSLEVTLVRGNHDHRAGDPDPALGMSVREAPVGLGPFELRHVPPRVEERGKPGSRRAPEAGADSRPSPERPRTRPSGVLPVLAGHLHPVVRLRGPAGDRARLPCFWVRPRTLVLPAFGSFTGGWPVPAARGDRIFVPVEGAVVEVGVG